MKKVNYTARESNVNINGISFKPKPVPGGSYFSSSVMRNDIDSFSDSDDSDDSDDEHDPQTKITNSQMDYYTTNDGGASGGNGEENSEMGRLLTTPQMLNCKN